MRKFLPLLLATVLSIGACTSCATLRSLGENHSTLQLVFQQGEYDCAIAAMAILGRVTYDDVMKALTPEELASMHANKGFPVSVSTVPERSMLEVINVLERLWMKRQYMASRDFDLEKDTGLLLISFQYLDDNGATQTGWHTVVIHRGMVYDPSPNGPTVPVPLDLYYQVTGFTPEALVYEVGNKREE